MLAVATSLLLTLAVVRATAPLSWLLAGTVEWRLVHVASSYEIVPDAGTDRS